MVSRAFVYRSTFMIGPSQDGQNGVAPRPARRMVPDPMVIHVEPLDGFALERDSALKLPWNNSGREAPGVHSGRLAAGDAPSGAPMEHQGRGDGVKHRLRPLHGHQRLRGDAGQTHLTVKDQGRDKRRVLWHEEVDDDDGHYVYGVKYVAQRSARKPYIRRNRSTRRSTSSRSASTRYRA
jgi:hypothetical protein